MRAPTAFVVWCGAATTAMAQTGALDQSSPRAQAQYIETTPQWVWQQQIRVGLTGQLDGIRITLEGSPGMMASVIVRLGEAPSTNPPVFATVVTKQTSAYEDFFVDMRSANIVMNAGDLFVLETSGVANPPGSGLIGNYVDPAMGPPLYPEPLYLNGSVFAPGERHGFDTYVIVGGGGACYPNCDHSTQTPFLNVNDFLCFQTRFAAGESYANCDGSTTPPVLNVNDFICFQTKFASGCSAP